MGWGRDAVEVDRMLSLVVLTCSSPREGWCVVSVKWRSVTHLMTPPGGTKEQRLSLYLQSHGGINHLVVPDIEEKSRRESHHLAKYVVSKSRHQSR